MRLRSVYAFLAQLNPGVAGACAAWVGTAAILLWPALPHFGVWAALAAGIMALAFAIGLRQRRVDLGILAICLSIALLALATVQWRAQQALLERLPTHLEGQQVSIWLQIDSLSRPSQTGWSGTAKLLSGPPGVPKRLSWSRYLPPGQWQEAWLPGACVEVHGTLRGVRGLANPWGLRAESYALVQGIGGRLSIRQVGSVLAPHANRDSEILAPGHNTSLPDTDTPDCRWSAGIGLQYQRAKLAQRLAAPLPEGDARALILALAMGDTREMTPIHWELHRLAGTTHLVSISGLHVTLLAGLIGFVVRLLWLRLPWRGAWLGEWVAARRPALCIALPTALGYALLSGWGVPAQRTVLMLFVASILLWQGRRLSAASVWCWTAALLTVLHPWALLTVGYWLSLGAVALLMGFGRGQAEGQPGRINAAFRTQWAISIGMMPLTAMAFQQVTWVAPLTNLLALPWITGLIMPLAVLVSAWLLLPQALESPIWIDRLLRFAHWNAEQLLSLLQPVGDVSWVAQSVVGAPIWPVWLALGSTVLVLFSWRGGRMRYLPLLGLLPLLVHPGVRPPGGGFIFEAPDVGQGSAAILRTRHHVLVFDTGPPMGAQSAAERVLLPALRAQRLDPVDWLFVSHADSDHASGWEVLREQHRVGTVFSNDPHALSGTIPCRRGQSWAVDGVRFVILHPGNEAPQSGWPTTQRNANSCVLSVRGQWSSVLLTGDIDQLAERQLMQAGLLQPHAIVLAPHHGAATSSSSALIAAVQAEHVWIQAGFQNRHGHPAADVLQRWADSGAQVWRSDLSGALTAYSVGPSLQLGAWRLQHRRWWHAS